ncbi:unnamed protein product [Clonostachys rosea f. rosea IK726]|uniref:Uncharacterized protein n=1 Tax=Clonostachys rosea f. rosea IK726 TaxID=1349383 RepID=A0ACA9UGD8_BIOOC|nr:unnamed protein product [Clonostachys rosea f. rosea IK726]
MALYFGNPKKKVGISFGGTTGSVVAGRLAEDPNVNVLVLEAGPLSEDLENVSMVGGWSGNFDKETDWNIVTVPGSGINYRQVNLSRGKFLAALRAAMERCQDYDDWDLPGWSGEEFFKYMRKAESFKGKSWFNASDESHGYSGHLGIEPHDLAPISELLLKSMESKGLALDHDMFLTARILMDVAMFQGLADFITKKNQKSNITIIPDAHVDKVIIESGDDGDLRAVGVRAVLRDGSVLEAHANKEVIISGGAYCSPNILNRSGIGARTELEQHGIKTLVDLPAVGKNLLDHLIVFIFYETEKPGLTNDHLVYHGDAFNHTYQLWKEEKRGFLSSFPFGAFAFARLDSRLADSQLWNSAPRMEGRDPMGLLPSQPNVEFFTTECYGGPKQYDQLPIDNKHAFSIIAELFAPRSRGSVSLQSADAKGIPVVDCGYLTDPLDVEVLAEACRFGNEIVMSGEGTKDIVKGSWPPEASHHKLSTREDWVPFVKENATTCYHAAGTCAMGKASNPKAVVDERLRVRGVKNLRVADCSIMPTLHGGHTQMPAFGIGEKAADMIKEDWGIAEFRQSAPSLKL